MAWFHTQHFNVTINSLFCAAKFEHFACNNSLFYTGPFTCNNACFSTQHFACNKTWLNTKHFTYVTMQGSILLTVTIWHFMQQALSTLELTTYWSILSNLHAIIHFFSYSAIYIWIYKQFTAPHPALVTYWSFHTASFENFKCNKSQFQTASFNHHSWQQCHSTQSIPPWSSPQQQEKGRADHDDRRVDDHSPYHSHTRLLVLTIAWKADSRAPMMSWSSLIPPG